MEKVKIGIVGCGKQAPKHLSGLRKIPGVELILADIDTGFAAELGRKEGLAWAEDINDIFADKDITAVDICTPTQSHVELIRRAVESGKDFFCEKPLCEKLEEARVLHDLLTSSQRFGMVGYIYRFSPVFELGYSLFEDVPLVGESMVLGKIVSAFFRLGGRGSHQVWKHRKSNGGGAINEMLVHMIDLALWYFGPIQEAEVLACDLLRPKRIIQGKEEEADAEDYVLIRLKSKSGVEVLCQADLVTPAFTQFVEVQGENGTFMGSIQQDMPSFIYCQEDAAGYPKGKTMLSFGKVNLFDAQMAEFVRGLRLRRKPSRCTLDDSLAILETLELLSKGKQ
jgi:predicted dehydrogenase